MRADVMTASDGKVISVRYWENVKTPRGAVVMVHGMSEYIERFDDFCQYLNYNGYYVMGMDNRGFGDTDKDAMGKGYPDMFENTVDDIYKETEIAKQLWNTKNVIVIGHSYGSFLTQRFIEKYHDKVTAAVLVGTALQSGIVLKAARFIANRKFKKHADEPGKIFEKMTFKSYDKKFAEGPNGWLCRDKDVVARYNADPKCGAVCSVGFYKEMFDGIKRANENRAKTPSEFKLMIVVGTKDGVGGYGKLAKKLAEEYRKKAGIEPRLKLYDGGRHEILNEIGKEIVYEDILDFLDDVSV